AVRDAAVRVGQAAARRDQAAGPGQPLLRGVDIGAPADRHSGGGAAAGGGRAPSLPQAARLRRAAFPVGALSRATRSRCLGPGATPLPPRPGEGGREATGWGGLGDTERRV